MKELKYSKQREAVLECLRKRCDHPTADALFQALRKENPKISLGTVYRNLGLLTELGKIKRISCGDGIERYDYITDEHDHFVCRDCGKILDLDATVIPDVDEGGLSPEIGRVESHSLIFYGCCRECLRKKIPS